MILTRRQSLVLPRREIITPRRKQGGFMGFYSAGAMGSGGGGGPTDPYWANVVALLHMDGANGSTTFTDQTGRTWTPAGPLTISTAQFMFGGASGFFGTAKRLDTPSTADFVFGTGNFTIEGWVRFHASGRGYLYSNATNNAAILLTQSTGLVEIFGPTTHVINASSGGAFALNTWYHVALVRDGNDWEFYRDGTLTNSATDARSWGVSSSTTCIGMNFSGTSTPIQAYIDEFRITKGVARYTANFTPTGPFPNS